MTQQTDHDLLMEISGDVKAICRDLKRGAEIMQDHEMRIRVQERCATEHVTHAVCKTNHDALGRRYAWIMGALFAATLTLTAALIVELAKR